MLQFQMVCLDFEVEFSITKSAMEIMLSLLWSVFPLAVLLNKLWMI